MTDARLTPLCRVLVVEDQYLIADMLCEVLRRAGATVLGPIGWLDEALAFAANHEGGIDCAVVDINLHGQASYPLIDELTRQGVHVVLASGFGADALAEPYKQYPRCEKPYRDADLIATLRAGIRASV